jgi:hypothetical protein
MIAIRSYEQVRVLNGSWFRVQASAQDEMFGRAITTLHSEGMGMGCNAAGFPQAGVA